MGKTLGNAVFNNFLGNAPTWYKQAIIFFLILNPILVLVLDQPVIAGWVLIGEFIFTLAMALKCYPLQPGGLLAIQAVALNLTTPHAVFEETLNNFNVILLLMFMVAGIYFMKDLLMFLFTKIIVKVRSKMALSIMFTALAAVLSAFLDALTVTAVLISVGVGFYQVYHRVASNAHQHHDKHDHSDDTLVHDLNRENLEQFRAFLRSLLMHGAVGTALGGVCTLVGEPQNLLIAQKAGWDFITFFVTMAPVTMPVLAAGLLTTVVLEYTGWFDYGAKIPEPVYNVLKEHEEQKNEKRNQSDKAKLIVQGVIALILCVALALHLAEVGLIGLMIIVLLTAFNGIIEEHQIGHAFEEALPFTALLVVFFAVVAVIHEQHLFTPVIHWVMSFEQSVQPIMFFVANGVLSMISDNVFVATVYISEVAEMLADGTITREHFDQLTIAINTGTNLPSVATPNGQAAFLFLLTSALAPLIRLSYGKMVWMALPYTLVLITVGSAMIYLFV